MILTFAMVFLFMKTHFKLDTSAIITILTYEISLLIRSLSWLIFYIQMRMNKNHSKENSTTTVEFFDHLITQIVSVILIYYVYEMMFVKIIIVSSNMEDYFVQVKEAKRERLITMALSVLLYGGCLYFYVQEYFFFNDLTSTEFPLALSIYTFLRIARMIVETFVYWCFISFLTFFYLQKRLNLKAKGENVSWRVIFVMTWIVFLFVNYLINRYVRSILGIAKNFSAVDIGDNMDKISDNMRFLELPIIDMLIGLTFSVFAYSNYKMQNHSSSTLRKLSTLHSKDLTSLVIDSKNRKSSKNSNLKTIHLKTKSQNSISLNKASFDEEIGLQFARENRGSNSSDSSELLSQIYRDSISKNMSITLRNNQFRAFLLSLKG